MYRPVIVYTYWLISFFWRTHYTCHVSMYSQYLIREHARLLLLEFLPSLLALSHIINEKFVPLFTFVHVINKNIAHPARLFHPSLFSILESMYVLSTYSGVSNNHTLCFYLFPRKILPCAFISPLLNSTMRLLFFEKYPTLCAYSILCDY